MMKYLFLSLGLCAALSMAKPASAFFEFFQGAGENYIAWEAEHGTFTSFDVDDGRGTVLTHEWEIVAEPTASGGLQIQPTNPGGSLNAFPENTAAVTYNLNFETAGTYNLYVRHAPRNNGRNSAYISNVLGDSVAGSDQVFDNRDSDPDFKWNLRQTYVASDQDVIDGIADLSNTPAVGDPFPLDHPDNAPYTFEVTAAQLGMPLSFSIKKRENLYEADRFVLTLDAPANNSDAALDLLANSEFIPEPSTLLLAGLSLMGIACGRRRGC